LSDSEKNKPERSKGQNGGRRRVAGREWRRGAWQTRFIVWRDTGASARATARAAAKRRPPGGRRSEEKMRSYSLIAWVQLGRLRLYPDGS